MYTFLPISKVRAYIQQDHMKKREFPNGMHCNIHCVHTTEVACEICKVNRSMRAGLNSKKLLVEVIKDINNHTNVSKYMTIFTYKVLQGRKHIWGKEYCESTYPDPWWTMTAAKSYSLLSPVEQLVLVSYCENNVKVSYTYI